LKILLDLLPVVVFFAVFRIARASPHMAQAWATALLGTMPAAGEAVSDVVPVILASACAIVATVIQVGWLLIRRPDGVGAERVVHQVETDPPLLGLRRRAGRRAVDLEAQPAGGALFQ
jgi:hypothetical protein